MLCFLFADLLLEHGLQETERERGLGRCTGFGDIDDTELFVRQELHEFSEVVLTDVVTCIDYIRVFAVFGYEGIKSRAQRLIHSACAEVRTTDTGYDNDLTTATELVGTSLYLSEESVGDRGGEMHPTDVVVSGTLAILKQQVSCFGLRLELFESSGVHERGCVF